MKFRENEYTTMFVENGILHFYYKEVDVIDLNVAKICVSERLEFSENNEYPCLVDSAKTHNITKEARDYFAKEGNELITANAILVRSSVFKMIVNFFIQINKPDKPTKMFTNKDQALAWLEQFKN